MALLVKLFLAHLLGDFILQPHSWVKAKEDHKLKSWHLYAHILIHGILIIVLVWDLSFLLPALIIMLSHALIDTTKIFVQTDTTKRYWFAADQVLHLAVLAAIWFVLEKPVVNFQLSRDALIVITAIVFITTPASVIIKTLISQWAPNPGATNTSSLQHAGKFIGILERLMVFTFAITNNWQAIGFLIAAKSVFRFGDLKDSHDLKLTEYVLIGTLLSFGIAVGTGLLVNALNAP